MGNVNGYEITSLNPGWINYNRIKMYMDESFYRIILFYVLYTPCTDLSSCGIGLGHYGWDNKVWKNDNLKNRLYEVARLRRNDNLIVAKKTDEMRKACEKGKTKKQFHTDRSTERIVIYKSKYNEFLSICYHIRNSFAHGRFSIYGDKRDGQVFVMEDGIKRNGKFYVRARMVLKKSTLLKWIDILEKGK